MHRVSDPSRGGGWSGIIMSDRQYYNPSTSYNQDYATYKAGFGRAGAGSNSFIGMTVITELACTSFKKATNLIVPYIRKSAF